jgi:Lar family restriction alleviation protein
MKPCPFCAREEQHIDHCRVADPGGHTYTGYYVCCQNCGAQGPNDVSEASAVAMWDMRRLEDTRTAQLAADNAALNRRLEIQKQRIGDAIAVTQEMLDRVGA